MLQKINVYVPVIIAYKYTAYNLNIGTDTDTDVNIGATLVIKAGNDLQ